jgi:hypothetical protein
LTRHVPVRLRDELRHLRPVGPPVDAHADPAPVANVWRPEEARGIREDHRFLLAERRGEPHRQMVGAVVVIVELGEEPAAHAPRRLAPRELLGGVRQGQTDRAQSVDWRAVGPPGHAAPFLQSLAGP